jgi:hypothetical protein
MEQIRDAHTEFKQAWSEVRSGELSKIARNKGKPAWEEIWQANGVAYRSTQTLSEQVNRLLVSLFTGYLGPLHEALLKGAPEAIHNVIDFLATDVLAFRCGYIKEGYLRILKSVPLNDEHKNRLREYGLNLCRVPSHRREIKQAGRLLIRIADRAFVERLRALAADENGWVGKKSQKMLHVVLNGRKDLR